MNNTKIKRTVEKVFAWIGNIFFIFITFIIGIVSFSGSIKKVYEDKNTLDTIKKSLDEQGYKNFSENDIINTINMVQSAVKVYSIVAIIILVLVLYATFAMKKRILSAVIFLITAVLVGLLSFGALFVIYVPYLITGIMLLVRKEKENTNSNNDTTINYV